MIIFRYEGTVISIERFWSSCCVAILGFAILSGCDQSPFTESGETEKRASSETNPKKTEIDRTEDGDIVWVLDDRLSGPTEKRQVWIEIDQRKNVSVSTRKALMMLEINCNDMSLKIRSAIGYKPNGSVAFSENISDNKAEQKFIVPGSLLEKVGVYVCRNSK